MNKYEQDLFFEKEYKDFLLKYRKKKEIKFQYYRLGVNKIHDCCFIGYLTNEGIHGLHYNRTTHTYSFGERNPVYELKPFILHQGLVIKIPPVFRDAFLFATDNRKSLLVTHNKIIDPKTGELVSR